VFDLIKHEWVCENDHKFDETTTIGKISTTYLSRFSTTSELADLTSSLQSTTAQLTIDKLRKVDLCSKSKIIAFQSLNIT